MFIYQISNFGLEHENICLKKGFVLVTIIKMANSIPAGAEKDYYYDDYYDEDDDDDYVPYHPVQQKDQPKQQVSYSHFNFLLKLNCIFRKEIVLFVLMMTLMVLSSLMIYESLLNQAIWMCSNRKSRKNQI